MLKLPEFYQPPKEAEEALKALASHPAVFLMGRAGTGKCVAGSTLITTSHGLKPIEALWPETAPKIPGTWQNLGPLQVLTDKGLDDATQIYYGGFKKTLHLTLSNGICLDCTPEHPIRVINNHGDYAWKLGCDLKLGDTVCIAKQNPINLANAPLAYFTPVKYKQNGYKIETYPNEMSTKLALLMGLLIGDGNWDTRYMTYTCARVDSELKDCVTQLFLELFGAQISSCIPKRNPAIFKMSLGSKNLCRWFHENDLRYDSNKNKYVPQGILNSGPEIWKAFISGLLATDGSISRRNADFEVTFKSERLIREVQQLFLCLGVESKLSRKIVKPSANNGGGEYWRLTLRGEGKNRLPDIFKFCPLSRKIKDLRTDWAQNWQNTSRFGDYNNLFPKIRSLTLKCPARTGYQLKSTQQKMTPQAFARYYQRVKHWHETPHREGSKFLGASDQTTLEELHWIYDHTTPLKITQIQDSNSEVWDLFVPKSNTFLANGIISHNSTFVEYLKRKCRSKITERMVVLAPTGIAAINIGGQTIHSFFRIAPHDRPGMQITSRLNTRIQRMTLLVIDEISMVRADLLDLVDEHMRYHTQVDKPFGGIPVLFIGDLFQLPPVVTSNETEEFHSRYPSPWFFYANIFNKVNLECFELMEVFRQKDEHFLELLNNIRLSQNLEETLPTLNAATVLDKPMNVVPMHLTSLNEKADRFNYEKLGLLETEIHTYTATIGSGFTESDIRNMQSPPELTLREGARVMLTMNINTPPQLVNGNLGWVQECRPGMVLVNFDNGVERWLTPVSWEKISWTFDRDTFVPEKKGKYTQIPLRLGWAISIHKAQGVTLDSALVDLGPRAFAPGQAYVALSRCRTLESLRLTRPLQSYDLIPDRTVQMFYQWKFLKDNPYGKA